MSERPVALVTGGATGIGAACCRALAADGFRVAIHYRSSAEAAQRLAAALPDALAIPADLAAPVEIDGLIETLRSATGRVDVLVNNAGLNRNADTVTMKLDDYDAVANVARGTWYLTKLVLRRFMIRAGRGRIITITSVVGHTGNRGQVPYTMVKAGLEAMTKSLAHELRGRGILVNAVAPGFIDTEMTAKIPPELRAPMLAAVPLERMGTAEEVADVVSFLATRGSYIHGSTIHVNGGLYGG
jgi:3-oxoacyl-[acyl-carrier protein] reductase